MAIAASEPVIAWQAHEGRRAFYRALANCGMGREVVLLAVKP